MWINQINKGSGEAGQLKSSRMKVKKKIKNNND